jgi:hypothetical protein
MHGLRALVDKAAIIACWFQALMRANAPPHLLLKHDDNSHLFLNAKAIYQQYPAAKLIKFQAQMMYIRHYLSTKG